MSPTDTLRAHHMIRVSFTGLLSVIGAVLLVAGLAASAPATAWEPLCRGTTTFQDDCLAQLVDLEFATGQPRVSNEQLLRWCGADQLCRISVLDARPAGDVHAELALCQVWAPDFRLTCEQGVRARAASR